QTDIGERNSRFLRLQAMKRAGRGRAAIKRGTGFLAVRVGHIALGEIACTAVRTIAAGNGGGDYHTVTDLQVAHIVAQLFDDADTFMAENGARLHATEGAANEVQISTAD